MSVRSRYVRLDALPTLAAPVLWSAYIAIPAAGWGWLDGVPLGWLEAAALMLVWWTWAVGRRLSGARLLLVLAAAKIVMGGLLVDRGFEARYYTNDTWTPPAARSTEFRSESFTRRDDRLSFGTAGAPDLPLYYFNDVKFNFYQPTEPRRDRLTYSAEWTGYLQAESGSTDATFYLVTGPGISSVLSIDGRDAIASGGVSPQFRAVTLENGWHALTLRVSAPYGASRRIEAGEMRGGSRRPFDGDRVFLRPVGSVRLAIDTTLRWTTRIVDSAVLASLVLLVLLRARSAWRDVRVVPLLALGAAVEALWFARSYLGRMVVLSGGNDWLTYESFARAIALGEVIRAGQDASFYYQALYPYFLALTHVGFGEGLFGVVLLQRLLLMATAGWAAAMTRRLFGARAGWIALVAGGAFLYAKAGRWTEVLLAEPLFMPLLVGWTTMLVRMARAQPTASHVAAAGVVGGIATLTRSTLLMGWPPILLVWWASLGARRARTVAALLLVMLAVVGLVTLRNWVVANQFVLIATSFGINLYLGNEPPRPLDPAPPERLRIYERLGLEPYVRTVAEFAIQAPGDFARGLGNKALYTVGFFGWSRLDGGIGISWAYVGMWVLAIAGVSRILATSPTRWGPVVWLPAVGALSHAAAVVLVFPHGYTDRLILPLYPLLIPYAAFAVEPVLPAFMSAAARLRGAPQEAAVWFRRHVVPRARPILGERRNWTYLAYIAAVVHWLQGLELLTALLLPVTALVMARLTRKNLAHRLVGGVLWAAALVRIAAAGSRSAAALHDPLFWGLIATLVLGGSAVTGRWPRIAATFAGLAGGCTMVATLLPLLPDFASNFPRVDVATVSESLAAIARQFGPLAALCLLAVWIQEIVPGGTRQAGPGRIVAAARGALLAGLGLTLAGAISQIEAWVWLLALGMLLGLVEAKARSAHSASRHS